MRRLRCVAGVRLICVLLVLTAGTACAAPLGAARAGRQDGATIERMIQESPDFSSFPKADGIIWLKDVHYALSADGSMTRTTRLVILGRQTLGERWRTWTFLVPEGGKVEIRDSKIYDPGTGRMVTPVIPRTYESGGATLAEVRFPPLREEQVLDLTVAETFPRHFGVDDLVWISEELPQWELRVIVTVPSGSELAVAGSEVPSREDTGAGREYRFRVVNTPAHRNVSLLGDTRRFIAFGMRKGTEPVTRMFRSMETRAIPAPPAALRSAMNGVNKIRAGEAVLSFVASSPTLSLGRENAIGSNVRPDIPSEGPWTQWEKILILSKWLREASWTTRVCWLSATTINDEAPATEGLVLRPILEVSCAGRDSFFLDLTQGVTTETPSALWGRTVYQLSQKGLESRRVSPGGAREHKLIFRWNFDLLEDGTITGMLDVIARNGWADILVGDRKITPEDGSRLLENLGIPAGDVESQDIQGTRSGIRITASLRPKRGISAGKDILVTLPLVVPDILIEAAKVQPPFTVLFPFVVEQAFDLHYPPKTTLLPMAPSSGKVFDKISYDETLSLHERKRSISGSSRIIVKTETFDEIAAKSYSESMQRWFNFSHRTLPVRLGR
jgi:hypothetical protein